MMHAAGFFRAAVKACRLLGVRGLFLTKYTRQLPSALPSYIRHCTFAPFQELFPHCAAVVHHGGVGTTARALAAGTPQLALPLAYDQADNAVRVKNLGVGDWLNVRHRSGGHLALRWPGSCGPRCGSAAEPWRVGSVRAMVWRRRRNGWRSWRRAEEDERIPGGEQSCKPWSCAGRPGRTAYCT